MGPIEYPVLDISYSPTLLCAWTGKEPLRLSILGLSDFRCCFDKNFSLLGAHEYFIVPLQSQRRIAPVRDLGMNGCSPIGHELHFHQWTGGVDVGDFGVKVIAALAVLCPTGQKPIARTQAISQSAPSPCLSVSTTSRSNKRLPNNPISTTAAPRRSSPSYKSRATRCTR